nr:NADH dehydrogenase subunit 4 [Amblyseius tsugawai]
MFIYFCLFLFYGLFLSSINIMYMSYLLFGLLMLLGVLNFINFSFIFLMNFTFDYMSYLLVFLSFLIIYNVILMEFNKKTNLVMIMLYLMMISLFFCFVSDNLLVFYIFFEFSLIPLISLILFLGGSMERFLASMYLFMYTLLGSLFLLLLLLVVSNSMSMMIEMVFMINKNSGILWMGMMLVFLIKCPIYSLHMWLPKAHVEGPVSCSMLLAGILLKLGGFGLIRLFFFMNFNEIKIVLNIILFISIIGALFISFICFRQIDLKVLVAYSSVSHMGLMLGGLMSLKLLGLMFSVGMMVAHGFCSSALFFLGNMMYERCKSRNLVLYKGLYLMFPYLMYFWLIFCIFNMGSPPSLNFFCELMLVLCVMTKSFLLILPLLVILMVSVFYSLNLFLRLGHGNSWVFHFMKKESMLDLFILSNHIMWLLIFVFKLNMFIYIY